MSRYRAPKGPTEAVLAPLREVRQGSGGAAPAGSRGEARGVGLRGVKPPGNFCQFRGAKRNFKAPEKDKLAR